MVSSLQSNPSSQDSLSQEERYLISMLRSEKVSDAIIEIVNQRALQGNLEALLIVQRRVDMLETEILDLIQRSLAGDGG